MNEIVKALIERRSCRSYRKEQIPDEILSQILKAGMYAPTAMNRQSPIIQMTEAVNMLLLIADKYRKGDGVMTMKELMKRLGVPSATIISYISDFEDAKMVIAANTARTAFIPARPLDQIKLSDILSVLFGGRDISSADIETIGEAVAVDFLRKGTQDMDTVTVENLLERI